MSGSSELDHLAAVWNARRGATVFAALADGLRKCGAVDEALRVAEAGVGSHPGFVPGHLTLSRIHQQRGDHAAARMAARRALELDPTHPVALACWRTVNADHPTAPAPAIEAPRPPATGHADAARDGDEGDGILDLEEFADDESAHADVPVSESLAQLYLNQGHLERALEAYDALIVRYPSRRDLITRRDAVRQRLGDAQPLPYDARATGGRTVRDWLAAIADAGAASVSRPTSGFDAFFEPGAPGGATVPEPAAPEGRPDGDEDLAAFQQWLKALDR